MSSDATHVASQFIHESDCPCAALCPLRGGWYMIVVWWGSFNLSLPVLCVQHASQQSIDSLGCLHHSTADTGTLLIHAAMRTALRTTAATHHTSCTCKQHRAH